MVILVSLVFIALVSLTVFGGGALFIPVFDWLWKFIPQNYPSVQISQDQINSFLAAGNATPGILSPKFAVYTGWVIAGNHWYAFLILILAYLAFMIPAISLLLIFRKIIRKNKNKLFVKTFFDFMFPVLIGVMISLSVSLFLRITYPFLSFNGASKYIKTDYSKDLTKNGIYNFFKGWRLILLMIYSPIAIIVFIILIQRKTPIIYLIFASIIIGLVIFAPWAFSHFTEIKNSLQVAKTN
ncbi:Chromate transporter [Mycoplasmopsis citelli]|uniref:Chromate transporter n=1 Tax=Mycoplasmopsis citelli TaxID=171281 RepID=A0A449B2E8_9BACT|nr:chromate transporter [Mycoplasmopsis citelli]VEU74741.1 Chromate transporter [Mycoplasmopsis citelli]